MNRVNDCSFGQKKCLLWQLTGFKTQWCDWGTLLTFDFPTPESAGRYPPPWQWSISFAAIFWFHMQPTLKLTRSGQHPVLVRLQEDTLRQCQDHDPAHHLPISESIWIEAILEWSWRSHKAIPENFCIQAMWLLKLQCLFLQLAVRCVCFGEFCNNMTYVVPWVAAWWVRPHTSLRTEKAMRSYFWANKQHRSSWRRKQQYGSIRDFFDMAKFDQNPQFLGICSSVQNPDCNKTGSHHLLALFHFHCCVARGTVAGMQFISKSLQWLASVGGCTTCGNPNTTPKVTECSTTIPRFVETTGLRSVPTVNGVNVLYRICIGKSTLATSDVVSYPPRAGTPEAIIANRLAVPIER